jgi:quinoprotein glucose dehydrogenase
VGPELFGVGRRRDREYVLRSILEPNAEVAPGFDSELIELKDGTTLTGVVKSETDLVVQIQTTEGSKIAVSKKETVSRTRGLSPMPDGLGELITKRELRDLIEALSR